MTFVLEWLRHFLGNSEGEQRQFVFAKLDALNADSGGGKPNVRAQFVGRLKLQPSSPFAPRHESRSYN